MFNKRSVFLTGLILWPLILFAMPGDSYFARGVTAARERKAEKSVTLLTQAIEKGLSDPDRALALILRGSQLQKQFLLDKALEDYNTAFSIKCDLSDRVKASGYGARGQLYVLKGMFSTAEADINKSIKFNNGDGFMYCIRGSYYCSRGNLTKGMDDYNRAVDLLPDKAEPYLFRGGLLEKQGKYPEAKIEYEKAVKRREKTGSAEAGIISSLYMQGRLDETLREALQYKTDDDNSASQIRVYFTRLQVLNETKRKDKVSALVKEAEKYINEQIKKEPQRAINYAGLGLIYCEAGINISEAMKLGDKANATGPESCGDHVKALCYFNMKDYENATKYMLKRLDKEPMDLWCMYKLGLIYRAWGKESEAQNVWKKVLKINPRYRLILKESSLS